MKALTLNTHSWVELHQIPKIKTLAQFIVDNDVDVVLLQEVNQHQETRQAAEKPRYLPVTDRPVHHDNYALILVQFLEDLGAKYHWSWVDSHEAWHAYDEGVAILSKQKPLQVKPIIMDAGIYDYSKVWRRAAVAAELQVAGKSIWFASTHMNWWFKEDLYLFEKDFEHLDTQLRALAQDAPVLLAGDFNNGCEIRGEGYDQVVSLNWHDTYQSAAQTQGEFTVHKEIAGWENASQAMRIDFVFTSKSIQANSVTVVFPDDSDQAISDHSGVLIDFDPTQLLS